MDMDDPSSSITPGNPGEVSPPPVKPPLFENSNVLPPEQYTDVDAALPLSFGVTVRKDFNRYIGVETGWYILIYLPICQHGIKFSISPVWNFTIWVYLLIWLYPFGKIHDGKYTCRAAL